MVRFRDFGQPHYMIEIPGGAGKIPLGHQWAKPVADMPDRWVIESPDGFFFIAILRHGMKDGMGMGWDEMR